MPWRQRFATFSIPIFPPRYYRSYLSTLRPWEPVFDSQSRQIFWRLQFLGPRGQLLHTTFWWVLKCNGYHWGFCIPKFLFNSSQNLFFAPQRALEASKKGNTKKHLPGWTWTHNPPIHSKAPYPIKWLGHPIAGKRSKGLRCGERGYKRVGDHSNQAFRLVIWFSFRVGEVGGSIPPRLLF